nr:cyanophycin synthetase [Desulfobaculum xiamenense]
MDFGLSRVEAAIAALGLTSPSFAVFHVVGTNGKGSTSRTIAELAAAHGLRAGLYTSPHFLDPRERIRIDGRMLSGDAWARLGNEVMDASRDNPLTYFEFITVLAVLAFARAGVDVAVMEAGLGGTYDAANALRTDVTVFTGIGMDHEAILGDTLEAIASDKAGAMRPGVPAVTAAQAEPAARVLAERARAIGTTLSTVSDVLHYEYAIGAARPVDPTLPELCDLIPAMPGPHQFANAHLALAAWLTLAPSRGFGVDSDACSRALSRATVSGRFQRIPGSPEIILDGAHNPHALAALTSTLRDCNIRPSSIVFACLADKDLATIAPLVAGLADCPVLVPELPGNTRARAAADIARAIGPKARPVADIADALAQTAQDDGPVLVCGSLYLLAAFFTLHPEHLCESATDFPL